MASMGASHAATITWGSATDVATGAGKSDDVSLVGSFHHAINGSLTAPAANVTVNGVTFTGAEDRNANDDLWNAGDTDNSDADDAAYNTLLSSAYVDDPTDGTITVTLGDGSLLGGAALVSGQQYAIQIWWVDDRTVSGLDARSMVYSDGGGSSVSLNDQYAIGTFTADGSTQTLVATTDGSYSRAHITALQVRNVTAASVPEPSSVVLLGVGGIALVLRRKK
ncbi:PEP-CTERM sorting domain-containing protein [Rubritalea tangerina]|uniref:PEP-CTERM sorting domain-containing protein n=1 Tax=Rubritalea tangerina TaxID=430798 RepID=UPI0036109CB1